MLHNCNSKNSEIVISPAQAAELQAKNDICKSLKIDNFLDPVEETIQKALVKWIEHPLMKERYKHRVVILNHSPNGGKRPKKAAAQFRAMGVKAGYPDITVLFGEDLDSLHGRLAEVKRYNKDLSAAQLDFIEMYGLDRNKLPVWCNFDDAERTLKEWGVI